MFVKWSQLFWEIRGWKKFVELGRTNGNSGSGDDGSAGEINQSELLEDAYFLVNTIHTRKVGCL